MSKRIFIIVLDSFGIGAEPDAAAFGDVGSNTLAAIAGHKNFKADNLRKLGLFNIEGVNCGPKAEKPLGSFARLREKSNGKDSTVGHWEIAGVESDKPLPTFPEGFPDDFIEKYEKAIGRKVLCNKPYSGTVVIHDYGEEHMKTGSLIVYTSADSVFQIAANEEVVPLEELYRCCRIAREMLTGDLGVGRVIARPFTGKNKDEFTRTLNRHDFSISAPSETMLDLLKADGFDVISVGKIYDLFNGSGITEKITTKKNQEGMAAALGLTDKDFNGLAFINLVDFDMLYGHRNDVAGYARATAEFDDFLTVFLPKLHEEDVFIITADHGCDPSTPSTDHSREYVPMLIYGSHIRHGVDLKTIYGFSAVAKTVCEYFGVKNSFPGESVLSRITD